MNLQVGAELLIGTGPGAVLEQGIDALHADPGGHGADRIKAWEDGYDASMLAWTWLGALREISDFLLDLIRGVFRPNRTVDSPRDLGPNRSATHGRVRGSHATIEPGDRTRETRSRPFRGFCRGHPGARSDALVAENTDTC
jgi:hypothetical protein